MARQRTAAQIVTSFADRFDAVVENVTGVISGKEDAIRLSLVCMMAEGHLLIEDVPGVGKTSLAKTLAASIDGEYSRIQFTPDLLPSDVTGVMVYKRNSDKFEFRQGGIFANIVLGDEINRASPKTQSALLEAMEERQVTIDSTTYLLAAPFMVIATQNPIEHEGTYPLPESQLDRFLMRIEMGYPDKASEIEILDNHVANRTDDVKPVVTSVDVQEMAVVATTVHVAPSLKAYLVDLADATRRHPRLALGVSPRGTLSLLRATRALAASVGREFVLPDDLKALAGPVLEHRLVLTPEASMSGATQADILDDVLGSVPVPTAKSG
ncbi:MAG TPA: MoxR family ATPase [Acidimicrobiales bacterium]|nr:MoxR family ATPase [Acidimicrobiales bacterium]